jgi:hypothetical protein
MSGSRRILAVAAGALLLATIWTAPAGAQRASVTRPGGSGSSGASTSSGGGRTAIGSDSRGSAGSTRPGTTSDGRTIVQDDRRPHGGHGGIHGGGWGWGYYYPWHSSWYWGYWGPWGYGYWGYPYGYGYGYPVAYAGTPAYGMGALDLNVRPKDAEVYVNGQYVGIVRQYDGFPGYLWLERGTYEVAFYRPGHETAVRRFEIFTGLVLDVSIELPPGEAVLPVRREVRPAADAPAPPPAAYGGSGGGALVSAPARLIVEVSPPEASVYLDGRFVGTGEELAGRPEGLTAEPGPHVLEVVSPGRVPESVHLEVDAGETARLQVRLEPAAST